MSAEPQLSSAEAALAAHHESLTARDYNRTKAGLGAGDAASTTAGDQAAARDVAAMYNSLADRHRTMRDGSEILHLRNLNNWVKSVVFRKHLPRGDRQRGAAVLDLACGKGGDMLKFKASNIAVYVGVDIAANSVRDAALRYNGMNGRQSMPFAATLIAGDYCDPSFPSRLPPNLKFQLASCQFSMHYAFRSEATARTFLSNATCRLHEGGVLVATCPDANVLVRRLRAAPAREFGNSLYKVRFAAAHAGKSFPASGSPFGLAYTFALTEAVDECEEYLVHIPTLARVASEYGLELLYATNFTEFFANEWREHSDLIERMRVLPADGAISQEEWDVAHVYMAIALRKRTADGAPAQPIPEKNPGNRRIDPEKDIIFMDPAEAAAGGAVKRSEADQADEASPTRKRRRETPAATAGDGAADGETRAQVKYDQKDKDELFE